MRIKGIQFLHVAKLPNDYQTTKLERDNPKHDVKELELVEHGVMMNGHHLFPWSAIMRVDYFPNVPSTVSLDPADNPLCDGVDPSNIALSVASREPLSVDIPEAPAVVAEVNKLESDLFAGKKPAKKKPAKKKRAKRKPTT